MRRTLLLLSGVSDASRSSRPMANLKVIKRTGDVVKFDKSKIAIAITKSIVASNGNVKENSKESPQKLADSLADVVFESLTSKVAISPDGNESSIALEDIQDIVEETLAKTNFQAAKAYILFREKRASSRDKVSGTAVTELAHASAQYFRGNTMSEFVYFRTYSRWIESAHRREMWVETVDRYMSFMKSKAQSRFTDAEYTIIRNAILKQEVMPSMRLLQFAGPAADKCNVCIYNCAYSAPETFKDLADIMYILMSGSGVGFSVEAVHIDKFPLIEHPIPYPSEKNPADGSEYFVIGDSREGWCDALQYGLQRWYAGKDVTFDYSQVRPAGSRLKTIGGRSAGPEPLKELLEFAKMTIQRRAGSKLTSIGWHDIICKIAQIIVAGGVRRSSTISVSDLHDAEMRDCKNGEFWNHSPQRAMANNSAAYNYKPTQVEFMDEWLSLAKSGSGERGIFNRGGLKNVMPQRRVHFLGEGIRHVGMNPCSEIILQPYQFCNLSEVVCRAEDDQEDLLRKTRIASMIGTYQASLTDFKYIDPKWRKNQEAEALLGVSLTGQYDCPTLRNPDTLKSLKDMAIETNKKYADRFGIQRSMSVTTVKPSGNVSQLVDSASGIHPRFSPYYIRRIRISATDPLLKLMKDQGYPCKPEVGENMETARTYVLEFPIKAPEQAIFVKDVDAIDQLEYWKMVKLNYTEHNPSVTIYVKPDEWLEVGNWVWKNWDYITGLSFLPASDHVYKLAPYEAVSKEEYEDALSKLRPVDFSKLIYYEKQDATDVKKELACAGGVCEL